MTALLETARTRWATWELPGPAPTAAAVLALKREQAKATTVFLLDRRGAVVAVAKASRSGEGQRVLQAEAAAARSWQQAGWSVATQTCPRVLELTDGVLWLSAVPGRPLLMEYLSAAHLRRRAAVTADFARAATWLDDLHAQTRDGRLSLRELTGSLEAAFAPLEGAGPAVVSLLDEARESLARWCPSGVPATAVHGDFWMGNLLVDRHRVTGVVDLELSAPRGLPMLDVLKLPLSYSLYLDAAGRVRPRAGEWPHLSGFQEVFLGTGYLARSAEAFVRGRLHRLGIPHEALRAFLPLVLAQQHQLQRHDPVASVGYLQLLRTLARHRSSAWSWRSLS